MTDPKFGPLQEPHVALTPPYDVEDKSLYRDGWENVELSDYERRSLGWVACWETHMVTTLPALMTRAQEAGRETNCNHNCHQSDREQAS